MVKGVRRDLEHMGMRSKLKLLSDDERSYSCRLGVEGPLFAREIERCFVRLEFSLREQVVLDPEAVFHSPGYPNMASFSIAVMRPREILAEKVRAIMTRNKARDIYDMWFLLERGVRLDQVLAGKKLEYYSMSYDAEMLRSALEDKKFLWERELGPIVFGPLPEFAEVHAGISRHIGAE